MGIPRVLAFAGSLRTGSYNKKLVRIAAAAARQAGAEVTEIDLRDYPLPIFDGDLEAAEERYNPLRHGAFFRFEHLVWLLGAGSIVEAGVAGMPQALPQASPLLQDRHLLRRARQGTGRLGQPRPTVEILHATTGELARRRIQIADARRAPRPRPPGGPGGR